MVGIYRLFVIVIVVVSLVEKNTIILPLSDRLRKPSLTNTLGDIRVRRGGGADG
jgi:hypothetical protein